jgi:predicted dienelactone hydrolase
MHRLLVGLALIAHISTLQNGAAQKIAIPKLPAPSGSFGIGRVAYHWMDLSRADGESRNPGAPRELMVYLWYPAQNSSQSASGVYFPGAKQINAAPDARRQMEEEFESNWPLVVSGAVTSHTLENAAVAKRPRKFPVVMFSHGVGGSGFESTGLFEDLVSHGYVVAAVEHTYLAAAVAFPTGRIAVFHQKSMPAAGATPQERLSQMVVWAKDQTETTAADLHFVLDKITQLNGAVQKPSVLAGRLDLNRIAALGHSAGGLAAARACQVDQRIKACISLDGEANPEGAFLNYPGAKSPSQPFLLVEVPHTPTDEELVRMGETRAQFDEYITRKETQLRNCSGGSYHVLLKGRGMIHASFDDYPLFASANNPGDNQVALHNLQVTESITRAFLDMYLKQERQPLFDGGPLPSEMTLKKY